MEIHDEPPESMRLVRTIEIDTLQEIDDEAVEGEQLGRLWYWYVKPRSADDDGSRTASQPQDLASHHQSAERFASSLVARLGLGDKEAKASSSCHPNA